MERVDQEYDDLETHYEIQRKQFHIPLYINPAPTNSQRLLEFRGYNNQNTARMLSDLNPDDCKAFCWKDCVIYGKPGLTGKDAFDLLDQVYAEWFPHRDRTIDLLDGNFFGKLMEFKGPSLLSFKELLSFHRALCERLQSLEADVLDREVFAPFAVKPDGRRRDGAFRLRSTFFSVFIVLEPGWQEQGVYLVCSSESVARGLGMGECRVEIPSYYVDDGSDLGEVRIFRCPLKRAMKAVVSLDEERAKKRIEYNEMFEKSYGSEDDG